MTTPATDTFLLAEDNALKAYLRARVRVSDSTDGSRPVPVFFGLPEKELHELTYPSIILELIDVSEAVERRHRGYANSWLTYRPAGFVEAPENHAEGQIDLPAPFDITYQITTLARHPRHDRQMLATLHVGPLEVRGSALPVEADETVRRLDRVGFAKRDTVDENRKRVYRNVFTYRVSAELFPDQAQAIYRTVERVSINSQPPTVTDRKSVV